MIDPKTRLQRIQRDIMVQKRLRQQKKARHENADDITENINKLRAEARAIQMELKK